MSDEEQKKVVSEPPPPTDEIDHDWGATPTPPPPGTAAQSPTATVKLPAATTSGAADEDDDEDDDEEDEDEDEDDDEEDEEDRARSARPVARDHATGSHAESKDWLPDWAPWAVLGGLIVLGIAGGLGGIGDIASTPVATKTTEATSETPAPAPSPARPAMPARAAAADEESVEASHLLVSYQGALRADPKISRTKEEAKQRAEEALAKAKKGAEFQKLVAEYSDEPGAAARGGKLGAFTRGRMVKPFADAAFALKPNELSGVVETAFGYHVILRTK